MKPPTVEIQALYSEALLSWFAYISYLSSYLVRKNLGLRCEEKNYSPNFLAVYIFI